MRTDGRAPQRMSEAELFTGYGTTVREAEEVSVARSERCVCGGVIRVALDAPGLIALAVSQHQKTIQHQAWWAQVYW